jgi:hypothetical protein
MNLRLAGHLMMHDFEDNFRPLSLVIQMPRVRSYWD